MNFTFCIDNCLGRFVKMEVILKDDIVGLGDIGQKVKVKPGYARNFLIPQGLAVELGARRAKQLKNQMLQIEKKKKELAVSANESADKIRNTTLKLKLRVAPGGKVFGSIGARDVSKAFQEAGFEIDRRRVLLADPIKKIGVHLVDVKLHADVLTQVKVEVEELVDEKLKPAEVPELPQEPIDEEAEQGEVSEESV